MNERLSELRQGPDQVIPYVQRLLGDLHRRFPEITRRIRVYGTEFTAQVQTGERARRLVASSGIGAPNATAPVDVLVF